MRVGRQNLWGFEEIGLMAARFEIKIVRVLEDPNC